MSDRLTEWSDVKREFDRYEFTWPQFKIELVRPFATDWGPAGELASIRLSMWVRDTYNPERVAEVVTYRTVPFALPTEMFGRWLLAGIREVIDHEIRENFKQDGVVIFDPHKEGTRS
jgi:hypothetical protein